MTEDAVYHVVPADGEWGVRLAGAPTLSFTSADRGKAVDRAATYVRIWGAGRVVVHDDGGQIETVHGFEDLPPPRPAWREAATSGPALAVVGAVLVVSFGIALARR